MVVSAADYTVPYYVKEEAFDGSLWRAALLRGRCRCTNAVLSTVPQSVSSTDPAGYVQPFKHSRGYLLLLACGQA